MELHIERLVSSAFVAAVCMHGICAPTVPKMPSVKHLLMHSICADSVCIPLFCQYSNHKVCMKISRMVSSHDSKLAQLPHVFYF